MMVFAGGNKSRGGVAVQWACRTIVLLITIMTVACATMGSRQLVSSHTAYNDAVQLTVTREVLANVVRSRYADPMQFMVVSSINAQFSVSSGGTAGISGIGAGATGDLGASIGYSSSPTITYVPQSDAGFHKSIMSAFAVEEAIGLGLQYRFARLDPELQTLSLRLWFGSVNGANDFAAGNYNEVYNRRVDAIVRLLQLGAVYRQVAEWDYDTVSIPKDKLSGWAMVDAFRSGLNFIEEEGGDHVRLARYRLVLALIPADPHSAETVAALEDLGVKPGIDRYIFRPPLHAEPGVVDPYAIWVTPRSMLDVLSLAARVVDVPEEHAGLVPALEPWPASRAGKSRVRIRSSRDRPDYPYRVQHRGFWFYVDDADIESKLFLEALVTAYSSRVGSHNGAEKSPQVVLPVGS